MKTRLLIVILTAVGIIPITVNAQNLVDSLFFRDGRVEGVIVSKSTNEVIQFSYPNESLVNEIQKTELIRIKYGSGRVEQLSVVEDDLPVPEPEFVGETYLVKGDNEYASLDRESPRHKQGAHYDKIKIKGGRANLQTENNGSQRFIVRAADNQSDPASIITIYKFKAGHNRVVKMARRITLWSYTTLTKSQMPFTAEKYGRSSYLLTAENYKNGEYGITVHNPNNVDEKKTIFYCIGMDNRTQSSKFYSQQKLIWYQGEVNVGGLFGSRHWESAYMGPSVSTVHGIHITKYAFIGLGAEYILGLGTFYDYEETDGGFVWINSYNSNDSNLNIFANLRGCLPIEELYVPYISAGIGYNILGGGLYLDFGVGFNYKRLNVSAGYQLLGSKDTRPQVNGGYLKVGVRF